MGKFYTQSVADLETLCTTTIAELSKDFSIIEHKKFSWEVHLHEKYISIKFKVKVTGRKKTFGKFSFTVSDMSEFEYFRKFLENFCLISKTHNVFCEQSSSSEEQAETNI